MKYGYETQESFSRAFTRFHGVSPTQARNGANLKSFSRLSVKLTLAGGTLTNYRIETKNEFSIICKKLHKPCGKELTPAEISDFWKLCRTDGTISSLCRYIPKGNLFGDSIVGASLGKDTSDTNYPYAIGVHYSGETTEKNGLTIERIPSHTYAVFTCVGAMPEAFDRLYQQIYSEFFPASAYRPCDGTDFEAYPSADVNNPQYTCEIWVAVEKKEIMCR